MAEQVGNRAGGSSEGGVRKGVERWRARADTRLGWLLAAHAPLALALAPVHGTWLPALLIGVPASLVAVALGLLRPGRLSTRIAIGVLFMVYSGLLIHQSMGMIELHFHIFGSLAFLLIYRDWRVLVPAAGFVAAHHVVVHILQMSGAPVYVFPPGDGSMGRVLIHAVFVVYETVVLVLLSRSLERESRDADQALASIERLGRGDFTAVAGDGRITAAFDAVRGAVASVSDRILDAVHRVRSGDEGVRIRTDDLGGSYREMAARANELIEALDETQGSLRAENEVAGRFRSELRQLADGLAERDLSRRLNGSQQGDYAAIATALNRGLDAVESTLADVATAAEDVATAASQINRGSDVLARGASDQASSLDQVAASLQTLSDGAGTNAAGARQARDIASSTAEASGQGMEAMRRLTGSIERIAESSDATRNVVKTIDEIAFQTNLLALNAAVEAARAGDAGKGFAVVAEEVRNLAMRSAEAAKETAALIADGAATVQEGVALNRDVLERLESIAESAGRAREVMAGIAEASERQTADVGRISGAVSDVNGITQNAAASAEESASAAQELAHQAAEVQALVGRFRLRRGSGRAAGVDSAPQPSLASTPRRGVPVAAGA